MLGFFQEKLWICESSTYILEYLYFYEVICVLVRPRCID